MRQLSAMDAMFLHIEGASTPMHIGPVMIYSPATARGRTMRVDDLVPVIERRLQGCEVLRRKLVQVPGGLDHPYWIEDPAFEPASHIHHSTLPGPGDRKQLLAEVARVHSIPLRRDRPLWSVHVIEGLDDFEGLARGSFAIYLKTHHASLDGASGVELVRAIHDLEPIAREPRRAGHEAGEQEPDTMDLLRRAVLSGVRRPVRLASAMGRTVPALRDLLRIRQESPTRGLLLEDRTRFNGIVSAQRVVGFIRAELNELRRIKQAVPGATINDVVLGIVSGGLRKYLLAKNELPVRPLMAGAPINTRREDQHGSGGNILSVMRLSLCTDQDDPLARLRSIKGESESAKSVSSTFDPDLIGDMAEGLPCLLLNWGCRAISASSLAARIYPLMHTLVTNVPGPVTPLYLRTARMQMIVGLGPCIDGIGLFHTVSSYCDVVAIGFQSCSLMLPDPDFYEQCLQESHAELALATRTRARGKSRGRRRAAIHGAV